MKECKCGNPSWTEREVFPIRLVDNIGNYELYSKTSSRIEVDDKKLGKFPCGPKHRVCLKCAKGLVQVELDTGKTTITHNRTELAG